MIKYRPEIDGLRAISVIAVIIYHCSLIVNKNLFLKGGFLGVDVFFVISGYLITSFIISEIEKYNKFSFKNFYLRRAKRLLPALFLVMIFSLPFSFFFLLPNDVIENSKAILSSIFFISNIFFYNANQIYGAENGLLKPFLHTWSLSIEEQYYIFFPILLIFFYKHFKNKLIFLILFIFTLSILLAQFSSEKYSSFNFYMITSRAWELAVGSILSLMKNKEQTYFKNFILVNFIELIGISFILLSFFIFNDQMAMPSFYSLLPVAGVAIIIFLTKKNSLVYFFLTNKLLVYLGLLSYSLYLWHFPIFAFSRILGFSPEKIEIALVLVLITLIFSIFTYHFVESPFRKGKYSFKSFLYFLSFTLIIILSVNIYFLINNGKINTKNTAIYEAITSELYDDGKCKFSINNSNYKNFLEKGNSFFNRFTNCLAKEKDKFVLVIGDSHGIDIFNSLSALSKKTFIIGLVHRGCYPLRDNKCIYNNALKFSSLYKDSIETILFKMKGSYMLSDKSNGKHKYSASYRRLPINLETISENFEYYSKLIEINEKSFFIGPHIEPNVSINTRIFQNLNKKDFLEKRINYDLAQLDILLKQVEKVNNHSIKYISTIDAINFNPKKDFLINNKFTYADTDHWSSFGEKYFGKKLFSNQKLKNLLE